MDADPPTADDLPTADDRPTDDVARLQAERDEWRRRAEVAEAVAAERLARAEAAERALTAAEAGLTAGTGRATGGTAAAPPAEPTADEPAAAPRPRSLIERWRRYTDTLN